MKSSVMKHPSMTGSSHTEPTAALMEAGNALVLGEPDNKFADRIVDFRSGEARCVSVSAAQCNRSSSTTIKADAITLLLLAQCVP
jgi:hypothetical protein